MMFIIVCVEPATQEYLSAWCMKSPLRYRFIEKAPGAGRGCSLTVLTLRLGRSRRSEPTSASGCGGRGRGRVGDGFARGMGVVVTATTGRGVAGGVSRSTVTPTPTALEQAAAIEDGRQQHQCHAHASSCRPRLRHGRHGSVIGSRREPRSRQLHHFGSPGREARLRPRARAGATCAVRYTRATCSSTRTGTPRTPGCSPCPRMRSAPVSCASSRNGATRSCPAPASCPAATRRCCSPTAAWCSSRTSFAAWRSGRTAVRWTHSAACA